MYSSLAVKPAPTKSPRTTPRPLRVQVLSPREEAALVQSVDGTAWQVARRFGRGFSREDLRDLHAAGKLGAVEAARRYDPSRGASFNTYATNWIKACVAAQAISLWGRGRFRSRQRVATRAFFRYGRAVRAVEDAGGEPTVERVAAVLGVSPAFLQDVGAVVSRPDAGYDERVGQDTRLTVGDVVADEAAVDALGALCRVADIVELGEALEKLDERERQVVCWRFIEEETSAAIAPRLGVTVARVQQIEGDAIRHLRAHLTGLCRRKKRRDYRDMR